MAFMVPLVKNHYDIYARNNPADHGPSPPSKANNSLYLSATSLKSGAPVTKQYRIVLTGAKGSKPVPKKSGTKSAGLAQSNGKLYYRMPSASISLPVVRGTGATARVIPKKKDGAPTSTSADNSPQSVSPPSRPLPHVRRTVRNPLTNRVYSYSVSIPDYVAEEAEEDLLEEDEDLEIDLDLEDKENNQALLFSTSAPGGTGPIAGTPTPPPSKLASKKSSKTPITPSHSLPGSPDASHPLGPTARPVVTRTHSSHSASSTGSNSREYVELLRKFVLHLKMLKIGGGSKKSKKTDPSGSSPSPSDDANNNKPAQQRARKRKDTMEDSKHL